MRISDWSSDVCSSDLGRSGWSRRGPPSGVPRQGQAGRAAREDAPTEEGALECVVAVHAAATEPGDLAGGVQALDRSPVRADDLRVQVGLDAAEGLAGEDVEPDRDQWAVLLLEEPVRGGEDRKSTRLNSSH